jgi:hypothetical protein
MPIARIQILPYPEGNIVGATVAVTPKGEAERVEHRAVSGSSDEASRTLYLEDGDKMIIDVSLEKEHGYDKEQFAATMKTPEVTEPTKTPSVARGPATPATATPATPHTSQNVARNVAGKAEEGM